MISSFLLVSDESFPSARVLCAISQILTLGIWVFVYAQIQCMSDSLPKVTVLKNEDMRPKEYDSVQWLELTLECAGFVLILVAVHWCVGYSLPLVIVMVTIPLRVTTSQLFLIHILGEPAKRPFAPSRLLPSAPDPEEVRKFRAQLRAQQHGKLKSRSARKEQPKEEYSSTNTLFKKARSRSASVLPQIDLVGPSLGTEPHKFLAGICDHETGLVFCPPARASRILCYDAGANTAEMIGPELFAEGFKYSAAVMGQDGYVYCPPCAALQVLRIDPVKRTAEFIGPDLGDDDCKYMGAQVGSDGRIYCPPANASQVLCIDTYLGTVETIGPDMGQMKGKYAAATCGYGGKIYCPPACARNTLCIDPDLRTAYYIGGDMGTQPWKYRAAVKARNGIIYCPPASETKALCINSRRGTTMTTSTELGKGTAKWVAAGLGVDGVVYCPPYNGNRALFIDPQTHAVGEFGPEFALTNMYSTAIAVADGRILCPPCHACQFLSLTPNLTRSGTSHIG